MWPTQIHRWAKFGPNPMTGWLVKAKKLKKWWSIKINSKIKNFDFWALGKSAVCVFAVKLYHPTQSTPLPYKHSKRIQILPSQSFSKASKRTSNFNMRSYGKLAYFHASKPAFPFTFCTEAWNLAYIRPNTWELIWYVGLGCNCAGFAAKVEIINFP